MAMAARVTRLIGSPRPRIAPPAPLRHDLTGYRASASSLGIDPMPWQDTAASYLTALDADDLWLYREVAVVVGRQQGKTTLTKPIAVGRMLAGRRVLLIAQVRELPRIMFEAIADVVEGSYPDLLPRRRGKVIWARRGAGSESIVLTNGGTLRIAAATTGAARGLDRIDDLIIDELREMDSFDVVNAAKPAQRFSENPQTIYLSNAGTDDSVVLNSLRTRAPDDPSLAYLEWSADPDFAADDRRGWVQADPAVGHFDQVLRDLEKDYVAAKLAGNMAGFETEALCRWVPTMREPLVDGQAWLAAKAQASLEEPIRPFMGISLDPSGTRAAAAIAWNRPNGTVGLRLVTNGTGSPIDTNKLGKDMRATARRLGVRVVGFDPLTDAVLAKYFPKAEPVAGAKYANASARFVATVAAGEVNGLQWEDCAAVGDDLVWTAKKPHDESGSFQAVRADDDRPIPAVLAAIRAVWLASVPRPEATKPVPSVMGF